MDKLEKIYNSSLKLLKPLLLEEAYKTIVGEVLKLIPHAESGSIFLKKSGGLERVYASNPKFYKLKHRKRGYLYNAYMKNEPKILTIEQLSKVHPEFKKASFRSDLIVPLTYKRKQLGLLTVYSKRKVNFLDDDLTILKLFSPLATLAIINSQSLHDIQKAIETRDLFISLASHELRTPLTTINMYSQLMKRNVQKGKIIDSKWIEVVNRETQWLTILFNELLTVNQIRKGRFQYRWGNNHLNEVVERSIIHIKAQFPKHTIHFATKLTAGNDMLYSDFDKLLQVVVNLLANSAKFSPPSKPIKLTLELKGSEYILSIHDRGSGIKKADLPHIYKDFYKGGGHFEKGMGLGLYITEIIVKKHGGWIRIDSEYDHGTKATIALPKNLE